MRCWASLLVVCVRHRILIGWCTPAECVGCLLTSVVLEVLHHYERELGCAYAHCCGETTQARWQVIEELACTSTDMT